MAKKLSTSRHPALSLLTDRAPKEEELAQQIPGWEDFTADQKAFLLLKSYAGTDIETARHIGKGRTWIADQKRNFPQFEKAIPLHKKAMLNSALDFMRDLVGKSILRLDGMLGDDVDKSTQLAAIKHIHKVTGIESTDPLELNSGTYINTANIQINHRNGHQKPRVVEVEDTDAGTDNKS
jgi:hypothetical protein